MQANDLRRGMAVLFKGEVHLVENFQHHTPGNKRAFIQATLRNLQSGRIVQNKFASTENIDVAPLVPKTVQFLYQDTHGFHFMDLEDYHTIDLSEEIVGDDKHYLRENLELKIRFFEDRPIYLEMPSSVSLKVVSSPPWVKGDSVTNTTKPAQLETGYEIQVPMFVKEGQRIKVDTRTGEYIGRD